VGGDAQRDAACARDVSRMAEIGLVEKGADGRISVPWDVVRAEF
jgi:hypothetical protein